MTRFASLDELRSACLDLPGGHTQAAAAVAAREAKLTKPPGSLGRLEAAVQWLALWQGKNPPRAAPRATFATGREEMKILAAVLASNKKKQWMEVQE